MATQTSSQDLNNLTINRVTSPEAFEQMISAGVISANEFYLVEGEDETVTWNNIENKPSTFPPESHSHGNITNAGEVTATAAIANGDKLAIVDNSNSSKITGSTITFDGSTTTKALTQKGTWETFNNYTLPTAADGTLGGIKTNYPASEKNYAIKVDGDGNAYVNVPWTDNNTTSFTITANATDGLWDLTGTSGTNAVTYALAPYSSKKTSASFYTGTTNPTLTTRLNYDGYLYATKLYSGGSEVLTSHQSLDNYKTKQTAITDSTGTSETSTATRFVYSVSQNANGEISVKTRPLPTYNNYSLPLAANGTRGGIQIGYSESGNNYAVKLNSEKAYVTVPLDTKAPLDSPVLTGTPEAPTAATGTNSTQIATTAFVANAVSQGFSANDAMVFKGTLGATNGSVASLPANSYQAGWTYRVADAGTYAGDYCEVGDLIIAINDGPSSGSSIVNADWAKVEHNIDGAVHMGHAGSDIGGTTQPVYITSSGVPTAINYTISKSVPSDAVFTDRYVNSAAFAYDSTNNNVKMTLTRAGSDTSTVTANIPKVSSSSAGVVPKGTSVSSQSQTTKFLREDGTWAVPSYTTNTNTDTLVKQTAKSDNVNYKLLFTTSSSPTSGNAAEAAYDTGITVNPSTDTITATTFAGNASTATSASKLQNTSKIGDTNKPVYFTANGVPYAINYTIEKNVPSNAVFTDTTYTFNTTAQTNKIQYKATGASSWTDVPITVSITNNITGSGTSGSLAKFNGTNTITNGPSFSNTISSQDQTTKFLREDGTWSAPTYTTSTVAAQIIRW